LKLALCNLPYQPGNDSSLATFALQNTDVAASGWFVRLSVGGEFVLQERRRHPTSAMIVSALLYLPSVPTC